MTKPARQHSGRRRRNRDRRHPHSVGLLAASKWQESWTTTGQFFRSLNTAAGGQAASEQARMPLGRVLSRRLLSEQDVPAPPKGYRMIRFRTDFENRRGATKTVSLDCESGSWKVAAEGVYPLCCSTLCTPSACVHALEKLDRADGTDRACQGLTKYFFSAAASDCCEVG